MWGPFLQGDKYLNHLEVFCKMNNKKGIKNRINGYGYLKKIILTSSINLNAHQPFQMIKIWDNEWEIVTKEYSRWWWSQRNVWFRRDFKHENSWMPREQLTWFRDDLATANSPASCSFLLFLPGSSQINLNIVLINLTLETFDYQ